ncbi:MAG: DUF971 domain-containing protein [Chlorobi bacterium]|nr:DUF971 domain-containing protein [Chlorobiota bacterium]
MTYPVPKTITKSPEGALRLVWPDERTSDLSMKFLRQECPCAHCKGETILGKHYQPLTLPTYVEGMYELADVEPVGTYAIKITWKDGHATGIYTWEYLQLLSAKSQS